MRPPYPNDTWPLRFDEDPPPRRSLSGMSVGTLGLILFLTSLTMLFAASIVAYLAIRFDDSIAASPPAGGPLHLPAALWASTAVLLLSAGTFHFALRSAYRGQVRSLRIAVGATFALGLAFIAIQTPALIDLLATHRALLAEYRGSGQHPIGMYGMIFVLILLHAAHVVGGIVPLTWLTVKAARDRLWPRNYRLIRACAAYWHFLDVVWLVMFGTFLIVG